MVYESWDPGRSLVSSNTMDDGTESNINISDGGGESTSILNIAVHNYKGLIFHCNFEGNCKCHMHGIS